MPPAQPLLEESEDPDDHELADVDESATGDDPDDEWTISFEGDDDQDKSAAEVPAKSAS